MNKTTFDKAVLIENARDTTLKTLEVLSKTEFEKIKKNVEDSYILPIIIFCFSIIFAILLSICLFVPLKKEDNFRFSDWGSILMLSLIILLAFAAICSIFILYNISRNLEAFNITDQDGLLRADNLRIIHKKILNYKTYEQATFTDHLLHLSEYIKDYDENEELLRKETGTSELGGTLTFDLNSNGEFISRFSVKINHDDQEPILVGQIDKYGNIIIEKQSITLNESIKDDIKEKYQDLIERAILIYGGKFEMTLQAKSVPGILKKLPNPLLKLLNINMSCIVDFPSRI